MHAAGIGDPGLPAIITAECFIGDLPAFLPELCDGCVEVLHFEAQVANSSDPRQAMLSSQSTPQIAPGFFPSPVNSTISSTV